MHQLAFRTGQILFLTLPHAVSKDSPAISGRLNIERRNQLSQKTDTISVVFVHHTYKSSKWTQNWLIPEVRHHKNAPITLINQCSIHSIPDEIDSIYPRGPVRELIDKHFQQRHFCACESKLTKKDVGFKTFRVFSLTLLTTNHSIKLKWRCPKGPRMTVPNMAALMTRGPLYFPPFSMVTVCARTSPVANKTGKWEIF